MAEACKDLPGFLKSTSPVFVPFNPFLTASEDVFLNAMRKDVGSTRAAVADTTSSNPSHDDSTIPSGGNLQSGSQDKLPDRVADTAGSADERIVDEKHPEHPFVQGLVEHQKQTMLNVHKLDENKTLTWNGDVAHRLTESALMDLFYELEEGREGGKLDTLLTASYNVDALATLKMIWNARSIHLGKSSRLAAYRCFGWLAQDHPMTLLVNLRWLSRPVIEKKVANKQAEDAWDFVMTEAPDAEQESACFDVGKGVAHGYWKDLLNILALSANGKLDVRADPKDVLNVHPSAGRDMLGPDEAKLHRYAKKIERHADFIDLFSSNATHRALHLTVARLFADQIKTDMALLKVGDGKSKRRVSLCAKWAPSAGLFHDKCTFIVSSIAEILHPPEEYPLVDPNNRKLYLRYARESYRRDTAALRKSLGVVERDLTAGTFESIRYDKVPSLAMNRYIDIFMEKDADHFSSYLERVADGSARISGATLLPSTLIRMARDSAASATTKKKKTIKAVTAEKTSQLRLRTVDGQWRALVQRIKDSGTLQSSIAVCDVSGSMLGPQFADGTTPLDSSLGLSLLLAEVTKPPFGGMFITFSERPTLQFVGGDDDGRPLADKVRSMLRCRFIGMSTDFVAVFEDLILPMAVGRKLKQEDMVKQIFVFSDMQFNAACPGRGFTLGWSTSYERIQSKYKAAGYEMPTLVFWNLAGGRANSKPVTAEQEGTVLVSGYSQGQMKMFLEKSSFDVPEGLEDEVGVTDENVEDEEGMVVVVERPTKKRKVDPLSMLVKAISHKAYSMLEVVD